MLTATVESLQAEKKRLTDRVRQQEQQLRDKNPKLQELAAAKVQRTSAPHPASSSRRARFTLHSHLWRDGGVQAHLDAKCVQQERELQLAADKHNQQASAMASLERRVESLLQENADACAEAEKMRSRVDQLMVRRRACRSACRVRSDVERRVARPNLPVMPIKRDQVPAPKQLRLLPATCSRHGYCSELTNRSRSVCRAT